jgi:hypothetical protein
MINPTVDVHRLARDVRGIFRHEKGHQSGNVFGFADRFIGILLTHSRINSPG